MFPLVRKINWLLPFLTVEFFLNNLSIVLLLRPVSFVANCKTIKSFPSQKAGKTTVCACKSYNLENIVAVGRHCFEIELNFL